MEPKSKRSKLDDGASFVLNKLKGRIVLRIEGVSEYLKTTRECRSKIVRIRGLDWDMFARPFSGPDNNGLEICIHCYDGSEDPDDWNCVASAILLCTSGGKEVEIGRLNELKFDGKSDFICKVSI